MSNLAIFEKQWIPLCDVFCHIFCGIYQWIRDSEIFVAEINAIYGGAAMFVVQAAPYFWGLPWTKSIKKITRMILTSGDLFQGSVGEGGLQTLCQQGVCVIGCG